VVKHTVTVQQSDEDYYIELPPEIWDELGWQVGDTVIWTDQKDGSWVIRKKDEGSTLHNGL
jgi:bifunctional DNA-binding transcriptional regulator/antitoxin component of YhaV-PrlF toxin-antitoxin module